MLSFSLSKFTYLVIVILISHTFASRRLRIRQVPTPNSFNLVYNSTASGYQTVQVRSYNATFALEDALKDCFSVCLGDSSCKMIFFYHCNQCALTFCDWCVLP